VRADAHLGVAAVRGERPEIRPRGIGAVATTSCAPPLCCRAAATPCSTASSAARACGSSAMARDPSPCRRRTSSHDVDQTPWWPAREISLIKSVLDEEGRDEPQGDRRAARLQVLGPLRFRNALEEGIERGACARARSRYAPAD
jgi:hypothetical protein